MTAPGGAGTTFAVAAPAARRVLLEIYPAPVGADAVAQVDLHRGPDGVWRGRLAAVGPGMPDDHGGAAGLLAAVGG